MFKKYFTQQHREKFIKIYALIKDKKNHVFDNSEDNLIARQIREHSSYFNYWNENNFDGFDWDEKNINPFMHVLMHYIVENELKKDSKVKEEMMNFFKIRKRKFMKNHDIVHMLAQIIAINIFKELRGESKFDENFFYKDLMDYAQINKKKFWEEFGPSKEEQ